MNCEEYRQALTEDPTFSGGKAHLAECKECQAFRASFLGFEGRIEAALRIPVPPLKMPELPAIESSGENVDNADRTNVVAIKPRARVTTPAWFALAASVALVAMLGVRMFEGHGHGEFSSLAEEIVAHLDHEPQALRVTDRPVSDARLERIVPANMANMNHDAGLITYARNCEINGNTVPHLVIQGKKGPVTVILLPDERVLEAEVLDGEGINGMLIPVGNGSIAIIGEKDEELGNIRDSVVNSVTWST